MSSDAEPCPLEVVVGQDLQDGIRPWDHAIQGGPGTGIAVSSELAPEEIQGYVSPLGCALKHDQRLHWRQAAQRMDENVGQPSDRQPRVWRVATSAMGQRPRRRLPMPWRQVHWTCILQRPQPVRRRSRQTRQQCVALQGQAQHTGFTRQAVDAPADPYNAPGSQRFVEACSGESGPAKRRSPGHTGTLAKKSLDIHGSTVAAARREGQIRAAPCGQRGRRGALRHGHAAPSAPIPRQARQCAPGRTWKVCDMPSNNGLAFDDKPVISYSRIR